MNQRLAGGTSVDSEFWSHRQVGPKSWCLCSMTLYWDRALCSPGHSNNGTFSHILFQSCDFNAQLLLFAWIRLQNLSCYQEDICSILWNQVCLASYTDLYGNNWLSSLRDSDEIFILVFISLLQLYSVPHHSGRFRFCQNWRSRPDSGTSLFCHFCLLHFLHSFGE